ncbi:hypothetical protein OKW40_002444 [Paraburkholderia sp. RAU6.4a]
MPKDVVASALFLKRTLDGLDLPFDATFSVEMLLFSRTV